MHKRKKSKAKLAALQSKIDSLKRPSGHSSPLFLPPENLFQKIVATLPDAVSLIDREYTYRILNDTCLRRIGLSREQAEGHHVADILGEEIFQRVVKDKLDQCLRGETVSFTDWFTFGPQQSPQHIETTYIPCYDDAQQIIGVIESSRDVTERQQAETARQKSTEKANALLNALPDIVFVIDRKGRFLHYKAKREDLHYQGEESLVGLTLQQTCPPDFSVAVMAEIHAALDTQTMRQFEYELGTPKGIRQWECRMVPIGTDSVTCLVRDITSQRLGEMELRQSEERFRAVLENIQLIGIMLNPEGEISFANAYFLQLTGWQQDEVLGKNWFELVIPTEIVPQVQAIFLQAINEGKLNTYYENEIMTRAGERRTIAWHNTGYWSETDGRLLNIISIGEDITQRRQTEKALQESEARFRAFMDNNPGFAFIKDDQNRYVYVNKAKLQFLQREEHEVLGHDAADFFTPEVARQSLETDLLVRMRCEPIHSEKYLVLPRGETKWVQEVKFPIQQADGSILVGGLSLDITEMKKAEQTLREQEQRLRQLAENIQEVYWLYETEKNRIVYVSPAYEKIIGQPISSFIENPTAFVQMVYPEDRPAVQAAIDRQKEMGGYFNEEFRVIRADGSICWLRAQTFPVEDENGRVYRIAGVATDVTEQNLALQREQELYRLARALAKSAQAINQTLQLDEVFQRILSSLADVIPHEQATIVYVATRDGRAQIVQQDNQIALQEESASLLQLPQFDLMRQNKEPVLIRDTAVFPNWQPLPNGSPIRSYLGAPVVVGDEIIGFLNLASATPGFFNETHRQHLQAFVSQAAIAVQNARLHEKLQQQFSQLQQAQTRLVQSEKLAAIGELVASIAHELNNPLTSVILFSQLLARRNVNQTLVRDIEQIVKQAQRAGNIVRGLLDFARQKPPEQEEVNVNEILHGTIELMTQELQMRNVTAVLQLDDLPMIVADPHQLQQVFVNLINNALQAMQPQGGGKLHISTSIGRSQFAPLADETMTEVVRIQFTDTGPGISPELQTRIFAPFFTTKPAGQGTGLGLSVSHKIINEHGGHLWVASLPGEGATFFIELPLRTAVAPSPIPSPSQSLPTQQRKRPRILVVDDEPSILHIVSRILLEEYEVSLADNIEVARQKLTQEAFDLILCDVYMPDMNGLEFYRLVRQEFPHLAQRFIFSTGDIIRPALQDGLKETGAPILAKPFDLERLLQQVQQMLS